MRKDPTYLGSVRFVAGAKVQVVLSDELPSMSPILEGRVYRLGQIGSFVRIPLGYLSVYGIVSSVGASIRHEEYAGVGDPGSVRTLDVQLVGEAIGGGSFARGLSQYPTVDDEVHAVTQADLERIYAAIGAHVPVTVGTHAASENLPAIIDLDRLVTRHCAIVGSTGSGKSNTVAALLKALAAGGYPSASILVVDPHGEYASAFEGMSRVFRIGDAANPLVLPYWALSFDELAWFLVDRRSASETAPDAKLREAIFQLRRASAAQCAAHKGLSSGVSADDITVDSPIPFNIRQLWYDLDRPERLTWADQARTKEALIAEGDASTLSPAQFQPPGAGSSPPFKNNAVPQMAAYVNRILMRLQDRRFSFLLDPEGYDGTDSDLDSLVKSWLGHDFQITVLDLAGVPAESIDLVVGVVTRIVFETMFWGRDLPGMGRQRPVLMVFEEAHAYIPRGDGGQFIQGYARRAVQRLLKEGRKYGVGAAVVSQRPSELDETILSQCGTFFALRLTNTQDQGRVSAMVPDDVAGLTGLLPSLRTGEALILGEAMAFPSRVRIDHVSPRPDSGDPLVSDRWAETRSELSAYDAAITGWRKQEKASPGS